MRIWLLILIASTVSWLLRALPLILLRNVDLDPHRPMVRFFNYAAAAVMGGIIYSAMFGDAYYNNLPGHFIDHSAIQRVLSVAAGVVVVVRYRSVFRALMAGIAVFLTLDLLIGE